MHWHADGVFTIVASTQTEHGLRIILSPNRSMTWRGNQLVLLSLIVVSACIGTGFALIGAWVILPFAGLEMSALAAALYYVSWKLSYQEVLTLSQDKLIIEKGVYRPRKTWTLPRNKVSLSIEPETHPWSTPGIKLQHQQQLIELGEFLNQADCKRLLALLRENAIPTRSYSASGKQAF